MPSPTAPDPRALAAAPLFRDLSTDQLARVGALLHSRTFPAGTSIMTMEQPGEVAYVVLSGTVKIQVEQVDGAEVILGILRAGELVGEMSLVDRLGRSATVVAVEDSTLAWMERAAFWDCLRTMPAMTFNLVGILSRRLRLANAQMQALATLSVDGRVARQLLSLAQEYGEETPGGSLIPIRLTQSDLAALVGASRVRVNQVLVAFKRCGYASADDHHRFTVHDRAALARLCD